jgi:hypothetical protein
MFKINKKRGLLVALLSLVVASAAFAYWTTSGSGTGTGSVASNNGTVTVNGTLDHSLVPGGSSIVTLAYTNGGSSDLKIGAITGTVTVDKPHADAGCDATWFSFAGPTSAQQIAANATADTTHYANGTASMTNETSTNQDACKGASLSIALTAAAATAGS